MAEGRNRVRQKPPRLRRFAIGVRHRLELNWVHVFHDAVSIKLVETVNDARFVSVVRRHLELHFVAGDEFDETFAHFSRNVSQDDVSVIEFDMKHRPRQNGMNFSG
ncbi:MAG: hypothetical protein ACI8UO_005581 [Verrucomicrobiales bacterium]|jgi:hypothetical protein